MAFVWDDEKPDIENIRNYVGYIIQTIENHNPPMDRVLGDLREVSTRLRQMK